MKTYVRLQGGVVFELFSTDDDIANLFNPELMWIDVTNVVPPPQQGWTATETNGVWSFEPPSS